MVKSPRGLFGRAAGARRRRRHDDRPAADDTGIGGKREGAGLRLGGARPRRGGGLGQRTAHSARPAMRRQASATRFSSTSSFRFLVVCSRHQIRLEIGVQRQPYLGLVRLGDLRCRGGAPPAARARRRRIGAHDRIFRRKPRALSSHIRWHAAAELKARKRPKVS